MNREELNALTIDFMQWKSSRIDQCLKEDAAWVPGSYFTHRDAINIARISKKSLVEFARSMAEGVAAIPAVDSSMCPFCVDMEVRHTICLACFYFQEHGICGNTRSTYTIATNLATKFGIGSIYGMLDQDALAGFCLKFKNIIEKG